jgi:hydrogenase maturation protein HypF
MAGVLETARRVHVRVGGVVQGVGFRPFVHRLACDEGLSGWVRNDARGVEIEAEGAGEAVERFLAALVAQTPPLALVEAVRADDVAPRGETGGFTIAESVAGAPDALVSADAATCEDCLRELLDPADRRFRYPFVNCTHCGPRFTIVRGVPYDRPQTTMASFAMCDACRREYDDPADRRFHAQPNACPACGPAVALHRAGLRGDDAVREAARLLRSGAVVAVKGVGGYHLACRASDEDAVGRLRSRKHREDRPFALMVRDVGAARGLAELGDAEVALITSPARPIVLAPRIEGALVAPGVAPRSREFGLMLPYSPLHHLLLADAGCDLVMTSGNVSDEPIAYRDDDAIERLGAIADDLLVHDRPIHTRTDDSVVRAVRGGTTMLRRSRGLVPSSLALPVRSPLPVLACGAELKSTFCLAKGARAWVGHHIGDLRNAETLEAFREGIAHFERLFDVVPEVIAHDLHPDYLSTAYAVEREGAGLLAVQHHHAHLAACLAEHGLEGPAVGAIYDGAGLGTDGTVWGGEILVGDLRGFERAGHLRSVPQPGADSAAREPWRMALSWLMAAGADPDLPLFAAIPHERFAAVHHMVSTGFAAPETSSMGRLFDAVAALCGLRPRVTYEGQAAIELEAAADPAERSAYVLGADLDARPLVHEILEDLRSCTPVSVVSARFHRAVAAGTAEACADAASGAGLDVVVLSGGVFQNRLLLAWTAARLEELGLRVLVPSRLPANDGGISFGQAAIAAARG